MGYAEKRGDYFRARYKRADGGYGVVKDEDGETRKFRTEREAKRAANDAEAAVRAEAKAAKAKAAEPAPVPTFGQYVTKWWKRQALAPSTMENYLDHIEGHLLPFFAEKPLDQIARTDVEAWELEEKRDGYQPSSIQSYRSILHLILEDAIDEGDLKGANPAAKRRGRGRRSGGTRSRGPEKAITTPLGALLIGERAALLSGRDDEFVQTVAIAWTGMRWSESIGLDRQYVRPRALRIEHQLYELRRQGKLVHCPPKDDSYRTLDIPEWLSELLAGQIRRSDGSACECHGVRAVFTSMREEAPLTRAQIAAAAGVSAATVSRALNVSSAVPVAEETRARVLEAVEQLRAELPSSGRPHWKHADFMAAVWTPAVTGWRPSRGERVPAHPVAVVDAGEAWPGRVMSGRYAAGKAEASWLPIVRKLTPHGLRHAHRTWMEELGTPKVLMDDRMGHIDGSVSALYAHVTDSMRARLVDGLTRLWEEALTERLALSDRSPVGVLDQLLQERNSMIVSQNSPQEPISPSAA